MSCSSKKKYVGTHWHSRRVRVNKVFVEQKPFFSCHQSWRKATEWHSVIVTSHRPQAWGHRGRCPIPCQRPHFYFISARIFTRFFAQIKWNCPEPAELCWNEPGARRQTVGWTSTQHMRLPTRDRSCTEQKLKAFTSVKLDSIGFTAAWMHLTKLLKKRDRSHVLSMEIKGLLFYPQQKLIPKEAGPCFLKK